MNLRLHTQFILDDGVCACIAGQESRRSAHSGMLDAAKAVVEDLKHTGVLEALMEGHTQAQRRGRPQRARRRGFKRGTVPTVIV